MPGTVLTEAPEAQHPAYCWSAERFFLRPVMEIMTINFSLLAVGQIVNNADQEYFYKKRC